MSGAESEIVIEITCITHTCTPIDGEAELIMRDYGYRAEKEGVWAVSRWGVGGFLRLPS